MDRRSFLKYLGIGLVTPKLIFDMGANLYKPEYFGRYRVLDESELVAASGWVDDGTLLKRQPLIDRAAIYARLDDDFERRLVKAARKLRPRQHAIITGLEA